MFMRPTKLEVLLATFGAVERISDPGNLREHVVDFVEWGSNAGTGEIDWSVAGNAKPIAVFRSGHFQGTIALVYDDTPGRVWESRLEKQQRGEKTGELWAEHRPNPTLSLYHVK